MQAVQDIVDHAKSIADGQAKVHPGQPMSFSSAASTGDGCWQGDLGVEIIDIIPDGYFEVTNLTEKDKQLTPGNTQGSRHCLSSLDGVKMFRKKEWGQGYEGLEGPVLQLTKEVVIEHPTHGDVTLLGGTTVLCSYQREYDLEQQRERRNAD